MERCATCTTTTTPTPLAPRLFELNKPQPITSREFIFRNILSEGEKTSTNTPPWLIVVSSKQKFLILNDAIIVHLDQWECRVRIMNQSDWTCVRKREASKQRHQVLGSGRWVYWMTLYFWLIKMASLQLPWFVRMCVINCKNAVRKTKTWKHS